MRDVEIKLNSFKLKKLVALSMCAVMAMGVMTMPVSAAEDTAKGETPDYSYTSDAGMVWTIPERVNKLLGKYVSISNGGQLGIHRDVEGALRAGGNKQEITEEEWKAIEDAILKAFSEIEEKDINYTYFDGKNVEDHQLYAKLMNAIMTVIGGEFTYDGMNTITTKWNDYYKETKYESYKDKIVEVATGDAKDPSKVIDAIKNNESSNLMIGLHEETQTMPKSVFQAAKESGKNLTFTSKDHDGNYIMFDFKDGIKNDVDMNFSVKTSMDNDLAKNLKDEGALVFEFAHEGVLPGPMEVRFYNEAYKDQVDTTAFLYLLNEKTGKLEKQEQTVSINRGWVTFTIDHCSSYVTTLTEIAEAKLQVAEAKPDAKEPTTGTTDKKDNAIKATGSETVAFQTIALLTLCGAAVVIASKKEKKLN